MRLLAGLTLRRPLLRVAIVTVSTLAILTAIFAFTLNSNGAAVATSSEVRSAFNLHALNFASENATLLMGDYRPNATLEWVGTTRGLGGTANGTAAIGRFFSAFFSKVTSVSIENGAYSVRPVAGGAILNGTFVLRGGGPQGQSIAGEVMVKVTYAHLGGGWVILSETWNFVSLSVQRPLG